MEQVMTAVSTLFNWLFVTTTGTNAHTAAVVQIIDLIKGNDFLLIGLAIMISSLVLSLLKRLISVS